MNFVMNWSRKFQLVQNDDKSIKFDMDLTEKLNVHDIADELLKKHALPGVLQIDGEIKPWYEIQGNEGPRDIQILALYGASFTGNEDQAICVSAALGDTRSVSILLGNGADHRVHGDKPLILAVKQNHVQTALLLLKNGADPNAGGLTPLHLSVTNKNTEMLALLLQYGLDVSEFYDEDIENAIKNIFLDDAAKIIISKASQ